MNIYSGWVNHRFSKLIVIRSAFVIALLITSILYGVIVYRPAFTPDRMGGDFKLYQIIVEQIHAGKNYYSVAGDELRRMNYATGSVFNWRLPALAWLLGQLPSIRAAQAFAFVLAITTFFIWFTVFHQYHCALWQTCLAWLILSGPLFLSLTPVIMYHEFWAGTLIALSLGAYARGWRYVSVASGLIALFLRELSLPFVFVMMVLSYREGDRREALIWFIGILFFSGELLFHWSIVSKLITENDKILQGGWIVLGGWPFVLSTARMHPFLLLSPPWVTAIILPLSLLGFVTWRDRLGVRVTSMVGVYLVAFSIAGQPANNYWGWMYAFVTYLGLLHIPFALRNLWQPISAVMRARIAHERD